MQNPLWHLGNLVAMVILRSSHIMMTLIFGASSEAPSTGERRTPICDIVNSANACATDLCRLLQADVTDPEGRWALIHCHIQNDVDPQQVRRMIRSDLRRLYGSTNMRIFRVLETGPEWQLWVTMELPAAGYYEEVAEAQANLLVSNDCCEDECYVALLAWLKQARYEELAIAKDSVSPWIVRTERDHAGNSRQQKRKSRKTRLSRKRRWMKGSSDKEKQMSRVGGVPLKHLQTVLARRERHSGKGSNPMFEWVNEKLQGLRSRGATGRLDEERKELADAYRARVSLDPATRASALANYREKHTERARQAQARNATEADAARTAMEEAGGDGRDPASHFGMGTSSYPVSCQAWRAEQQRVSPSGGLGVRRAAARSLPEVDLVTPLANRRLRLPGHFRETCRRRTKGVCFRHIDNDIEARARRIHATFVRIVESKNASGTLVLRCYDSLEGEGRDVRGDKHVCFSSFRGNPKHHAEYTMMFRVGLRGDDGPQLDEFPFILGDKMLTQPACGIYADITAEYLALDQVTSWYLCWKLSEARALTVCVWLGDHVRYWHIDACVASV